MWSAPFLTVSTNGLAPLNPYYNQALLQVGKNYSHHRHAGNGLHVHRLDGRDPTLPLTLITKRAHGPVFDGDKFDVAGDLFGHKTEPVLSITNRGLWAQRVS